MVEKKEGAKMSCKNCDTELTCRLRDYGGDYKPTLQWQNEDGTAHYKTNDGKNFSCNIPDEEPSKIDTGQTTITPPARTAGDIAQPRLERMENKLDSLLHEISLIKGMVEPLFKKMVDEQIGRVNE